MNVFQRPRGEGWLVLSDHVPSLEGEFSELANSLLTHADLSYRPLCILAGKTGDSLLQKFLIDLEVLLNVEIIVVTLQDVGDWDLIHPGILILSGGKPEEWVTALGETHVGVLILEAFQDGLLLFAADAAASGLGSWVLGEADNSPFPGLNWLVGSLVLPWAKDPAENESVRSVLLKPEPLYAMGLAGGRIIALGPSGEVQLWGVDAPTIVLGSGWRKQ
jgi:hypothetical protein